MNPRVLNQLHVIRDNLSTLGNNGGAQPAQLALITEIIDLMIVNAVSQPVLEERRLDRVRKALPIYEEAARPARTPNRADTALLNCASEVLASELEYWSGYEAAVRREKEMAERSTSNPGRGLDRARVELFLRSVLPHDPALRIRSIEVMSMGYSKRTYRIDLDGVDQAPASLIIRADQPGHYIKTTVVDEYSLLVELERHGVPVPPTYAVEPTGSVIGAPFILVGLMPGALVGDSFNPPPTPDSQLAQSSAVTLARIHSIPLEHLREAGLDMRENRPFILDEIASFAQTWAELESFCPLLDLAFAWLRNHVAWAHGRRTLVHNDYGYSNLLVSGSEITAVLDWEFGHIGNPAADIGYAKYVIDRMCGMDRFKREYVSTGQPFPSDQEIFFYHVWSMTRLAVFIFQSKEFADQGSNRDIRFTVAEVRYLRKPLLEIAAQLKGPLGLVE